MSIDTANSRPLSSLVLPFASLFSGRPDAWGTVTGGCVKEKVTLEHYHRHLAGEVSLGIYPLRQDGLCRWFAIDIDQDDLMRALDVIDQLAVMRFSHGIYLERSKSKGYHILGLLSDWAPTRHVRRIARVAICKGGLPASTEIFPKQDNADGIRWGNYLNLPYFGEGSAQGRRMFLDLKSFRPVPLPQMTVNKEMVFSLPFG
jgi:hypothetical protein